MECQRCGQEIPPGDERKHNGQTLCEDCYMDALSPVKSCDPWATYTATRLKDQAEEVELTATQQAILTRLEQNGFVAPLELAERLGLSLAELEREVAVLRHMELVRAAMHDGRKCLTLF